MSTAPGFNRTVNSPTDLYVTTAINARSGNAYTITTGIDNNKDGVINDRPLGLEKNTEFGPGLFDVLRHEATVKKNRIFEHV